MGLLELSGCGFGVVGQGSVFRSVVIGGDDEVLLRLTCNE